MAYPRIKARSEGSSSCERAQEGCENAAAVDVPHQQAGGVRRARHAHVHDIVFSQVDLGRRAGSFKNYHLVIRRQFLIAFQNHRKEILYSARVIIRCRHLAPDPPQQDDLRACVRRGFDEHRIHFGTGRYPASLGLQSLGAAYLAPIGRGGRVERHVLGLERRHPPAVVGQDSAQRSRNDRLAGVGRRSQHHQSTSGFTFPSPCSRGTYVIPTTAYVIPSARGISLLSSPAPQDSRPFS